MSYSVAGRVALVTGAARGLGLAIAGELAARGARVVATDVDGDALVALPERLPGVSALHPLDVTDAEQIVDLHRRLAAEIGPVEILVNNAGTVHGGAFLEVPLQRHLDVYAVNLAGLVATTHTFLPDLLAADAGRLVNIASASGFLALPWAASYASSKWAVVGFSESVRLELAELGHDHVRVTTVCPGYIDTGLFDGVRQPRGTRRLAPGEVARRVVEATERGERRLLLPPLTRVAPLLVSLPGGLADALSRWLGVASSMRRWRGRGD